jgi:methylthioribulose-1-phosphate dehydratase
VTTVSENFSFTMPNSRKSFSKNIHKASRPDALLEASLADLARHCYDRSWLLGTSGNFSAVVKRSPLTLTITATGLDKGALAASQFVRVNAEGAVTDGTGRPSAETALHLVVVRLRQAGAVLHTHSVWSTMLSDLHAGQGGVAIEGYEMLKGLTGVTTHTHREWLPIFENDQDMQRLSGVVEAGLRSRPDVHGFLLRNHGLYTWGDDLQQAKRHLEILEFLLEVLGRTQARPAASAS